MPPGFKIEVWASNVPQARQMALGDKGTLFVGTFDKGTVHAVSGPDGQKVAKPYITGLRMPTGVAFMDGALYVIDIDKLYKYDNPEASLDKAPAGKVVYDDMPPYVPHGWKYLVPDGKGWFYVPFGPPCNVCLPPTSLSQYRRVNPANGTAELVAIGMRNSVGVAVIRSRGSCGLPTTAATGWATTFRPTSSTTSPSAASISAIRTATGDIRTRSSARDTVLGVHAARAEAGTARRVHRHALLHRHEFRRVSQPDLHRRAWLVEPQPTSATGWIQLGAALQGDKCGLLRGALAEGGGCRGRRAPGAGRWTPCR